MRSLERLKADLTAQHDSLKSWRKAAEVCGVMTTAEYTEEGTQVRPPRPDPALAYRIAVQGYEPRRQETRTRLGLPPVCIVCGQKVHRKRIVPSWVKEATRTLKELESKAEQPDKSRVYARGGRRAA